MKKRFLLLGGLALVPCTMAFLAQGAVAEPVEGTGVDDTLTVDSAETLEKSGEAEPDKENSSDTPEERAKKIERSCKSIRENLVETQHNDSRERVYLGRRYEMILAHFITPLNVALVENNSPNENLIAIQSDFVRVRTKFAVDFVEYQKALETLIKMNCATEPEKFSVELSLVRKLRAAVASDAKRLEELVDKQLLLVGGLRGKL